MSLDTSAPDGDTESATEPAARAAAGPAYDRDAAVDPVTDTDTGTGTDTGSYSTDTGTYATGTYATDTGTYATDTSSYGTDTGSYGTDAETDAGTDVDADRPQPTFTPADETSVDDGTDTGVRTDPAFDDADATGRQPAVTSLADEPVATAPVTPGTPAAPADGLQTTSTTGAPLTSVPADEPVAAVSGDEPLLANAAGMQASWQAVQAGFVDDPQAAVSEAADLIEQTAQSLIDALQERQRQLRVPADGVNGNATGVGDPTAPGYAAASGVPDTEQLRLMMQRYRSLFNTLSNA